MRIRAFFVSHDGRDIELADAWDQYTIDENPDGYEEARLKVRSEVGHFAEVELEVSEALIRTALFPEPMVVVAEVVTDS